MLVKLAIHRKILIVYLLLRLTQENSHCQIIHDGGGEGVYHATTKTKSDNSFFFFFTRHA